MIQLIRYRDGRQAIQHDHVRLAVPPMGYGTPRPIRRAVYELVLRRQPALAALVAGRHLEVPDGGTFSEVQTLIADRPGSAHLNEAA